VITLGELFGSAAPAPRAASYWLALSAPFVPLLDRQMARRLPRALLQRALKAGRPHRWT